MGDLSAVIVPKSDQINADDLIAGPRTITITDVRVSPGTEQPVSIFFEGDKGKPFRPCKSMTRLMVSVWGPDSAKYPGNAMTIYRDPSVKWAGMAVGGIRISHMSGLTSRMEIALTETKGKRKITVVEPLKAEARTDEARAAVDKITGNIARAPDAAKLEQYLAGANVAGRIADWRTSRPDLVALIDTARAAKMTSFGGEDDDPFGLEGGATEGATEEAPPSAPWSDRIAACASLSALATLESEWFAVREGQDDAEQIDGLFDAARDALKRKAAA
jgi:hypothetical protein